MRVSYKLDGLEEFLKQVSRQPEIVKQIVSKEIDASAMRVEKKAKYYAAWDTGFMSTGIYSLKKSALLSQVISPAFYSIYVELGTRKMMAQPFMYPALEEDFPILMNRLRRVIK